MNPKDDLCGEPTENIQTRRLKNQLAIFKGRAEQAENRTISLEALFEQYAQLSSVESIGSKPMTRAKSSRHTGVGLIHWTDWHVAEVVQKSKTNGMNRFNPEICKKRVEGLVEGSISLVQLYRKTIEINELVLILGGDFITGYLHPELEQTNAMGPVEESYYAIQLLEWAITELIQATKPKKIRIVCHRGNHGRTTKKMQFKNDFETNHETLVYWVLRDRLQDKTVEWVIDENAISYTELIKGYFVRSYHGHQIRYNGGVGGLLVPANRWVLKQNQTKKAVLSIMGHFHQYNQMKGVTVSGSLKGWDEYAMEHGFEYEEPSQSFTLFDCRRRMFTAASPILCE